MNPESTQVGTPVVPPVADSTETSQVASHDGTSSTPMAPDATEVRTVQEPTAPVPAPVRLRGGTLRLTFKLRLEGSREVLLDLDDSVDFRHGPYRQSVAIVGDQVRKVFEAIVAEPLLTTVNQYVRLKLDAGQASPDAVKNPDVSPFPQFPAPNATEADSRPFSGPDHP